MKDKKTNIVMGIDPSINDCGVSVFKEKRCIVYRLLHPDKGAKNFQTKSLSLFADIIELTDRYSVETIILEIPEYWGTAGFIARESGSLFKMSFLCGMIYTFNLYEQMTVELVTPREWKGQMPKDVCRNRLKKYYIDRIPEFMTLNHNIVDAIGIAHHRVYGKV